MWIRIGGDGVGRKRRIWNKENQCKSCRGENEDFKYPVNVI